MFRYVLVGQVLGSDPPFPNFNDTITLKDNDLNLEFDIMLNITNAIIGGAITSQQEIIDTETLRNFIRDWILLFVNTQGYIHGCYYDVEIISIMDVQRLELHKFATEITEIASDYPNRAINDPNQIIPLFEDLRFRFLRSSFQDMALAMKYPKDTGFFCYRAIESLRKFFDESNDSNGWQLLRTNLNVSRSFIDVVKRFANDPRHGGLVLITSPERVNAMQNTWKIVDRFILYALNGCNPLDNVTYPELQ